MGNEKLWIFDQPPTGALKVHATPTAQAAANISDFRHSFAKAPSKFDATWLNKLPQIEAICTKGP